MQGLTLGYLSIADVPPLGVIRAAAGAGFSAAGIRITGRKPEDAFGPDIVGAAAAIAQIRDCLATCGMRLSNVSAYHLYPQIRMQDLLPVLETSAVLGARFVVAAAYDPVRPRMVDLLGRYGEAASAAGLKIALEPVSYSAASTLDEAYGLVLAANQPNLGLLLDPLHLARAGDTPASIARIDTAKIFYAQLCDASARKPEGIDLASEAKSMRLYPGEGQLPLTQFLRALPAGVEIEAEVPAREHRHLTGDERAAILYQKVSAYLQKYSSQRPSTGHSIYS